MGHSMSYLPDRYLEYFAVCSGSTMKSEQHWVHFDKRDILLTGLESITRIY